MSEESQPTGTYNCPICGWNEPHSEHAGAIIDRLYHERKRLVDAVDEVFRRVEVLAQVQRQSFPPGLVEAVEAAMKHYKWVQKA